MWLLIAFIAVPLIEIGLFIQVGGFIGLFPTLAIVLITAIAGTYLVRSQGLATLEGLQRSIHEAGDPTEHLIHGAMILFAGALLLTPGFFTDAVGLSLMIPSVRMMLFAAVRKRFFVVTPGQAAQQPHPYSGAETIIEGEYHDVTPEEPATKGQSGWTKH
ncbi:MAG: FxsA family protein [Rhodobacteraceae bacterium]|nr:FxsA family protein [Paracoccaceae bacterium]